jgi:hypothetical protein
MTSRVGHAFPFVQRMASGLAQDERHDGHHGRTDEQDHEC